jgi:hypothetical protein
MGEINKPLLRASTQLTRFRSAGAAPPEDVSQIWGSSGRGEGGGQRARPDPMRTMHEDHEDPLSPDPMSPMSHHES